MNKILSASVTALAVLSGSSIAAQPTTVDAGHTVLTLPAGIHSFAAPLKLGVTGGASIPIVRQVVQLTYPDRPPAVTLLIDSTREAGRYVWTESCKKLRNDEHTYVHNPFQAMGNECVFAVGLIDIAAVVAESFPDLELTLRAGNQSAPEGVGYIVHSTYATSSGTMLSVTSFVREPFAQLSTSPEAMPGDTGIPAPVVAWTRALHDQVRGAMRSFSGAWQLPALSGYTDD